MELTNKKVLADTIAENQKMTKKQALEIVDIVFDTISETLKEGGKVDISGFGKFEVSKRAAREGINPQTKEKITIGETAVPKFKASKVLKDLVK